MDDYRTLRPRYKEIISCVEVVLHRGAAYRFFPLPKLRMLSSPFPPRAPSERVSLHQHRAVVTRSSQKFIPKLVRISKLCRTSHSSLHSLLLSALLSFRCSTLRYSSPFAVPLFSLAGEVHVDSDCLCTMVFLQLLNLDISGAPSLVVVSLLSGPTVAKN